MSLRQLKCSTAPTRGFTLIELMAALAVLAILASLAVPAWHEQLQRGWRAQARAELAAALLALERHATEAMSFATHPGSDTIAGNWPRTVPANSPGRHVVSAVACEGATLDTCVELHAVPRFADPRCGVLVLRSTGQWLSWPQGQSAPGPLPPSC